MAKIKAGIVGTGYAANKRAEALKADERVELVAVAGSTASRVEEFGQNFEIEAVDSWQKLVNSAELDLIFVCTVNSLHGAIAATALAADKHVVVEYPLALDPQQATDILALAAEKNKLLHVEHIELLGGLHQTIKQNLPEIGNAFYARYRTISPKRNVALNWKYHRTEFGFPLAAALSRIHRLTDLFGAVKTVSCQHRYWNSSRANYFTACLCNAQLKFANKLVAEVVYGKGDVFWQGDRTFEIHGDRGTLVFAGERGTIIRGDKHEPISVQSRRGLFARDTTLVLNFLTENNSLYVRPQASLYALQVAEATRIAAASESLISL
ncbi:Gfo/Idh/MocA family protein [Myxosarcina sp. GI1]|uniref:Gfo/Idh/MocA family protein n=1 Tax=Myxosarcina sp. GI1 TaxID=1541065 RepID=UPI00056D1C1E|nr:Gfo/Idh/MocA family oxidoreductase [Myxosarcina sp. GI1]